MQTEQMALQCKKQFDLMPMIMQHSGERARGGGSGGGGRARASVSAATGKKSKNCFMTGGWRESGHLSV
jgi:hypothetical protein